MESKICSPPKCTHVHCHSFSTGIPSCNILQQANPQENKRILHPNSHFHYSFPSENAHVQSDNSDFFDVTKCAPMSKYIHLCNPPHDSTQRQESWMWALLLTALRAVGAGEGNCTQECILHMYSYKLTAGNLSGSCLALECFKPIPQNSLHFPEAQYFLSLLSWLLLSSSTAKPSLHYLTLHWTQIPSAGWKLHSKLILFIAILVYLHTF